MDFVCIVLVETRLFRRQSASLKKMRSFFSLILLQIIGPIHPRRLGNRHGTLQSSMSEQVATSRFSALYGGRNWAEVTHLPPGWEILDFGAPGDQMRFQKSRGHSKDPSEEQSDPVRCVQSADHTIHCHGGGLTRKTEDVSDWTPGHAHSPGGVFTKDVDPGEGSSVDGNPTSSGSKLQNTKPNDNEKNSPSSENALGTSDQSSPTGDTKEEKNKDSTDTKPGTENESNERDYVIGGGFVVTLKVFSAYGCIVPDSL